MNTTAHLLRLIKPFSGWIALAVLLGVLTVGSGIGLMMTSAFIISSAALHPSIAELSVAVVGVRFFGIARGVFRYLERYASHSVNFRLLVRLRVWFYEALEPLAPAILMHYKSGDLLTRAVADIETLQDFYVRVIAPPLVALVIALGMGLVFWQFDPMLALVLLVGLALTGLGVPSLVRRLSQQPGGTLISVRAALQGELVDDLQGLADLAAFNQESRKAATVRALGADYERVQTRLSWINGGQAAVSNLLTNLTLWGVLVVAIGLVSAGKFSGLYLAVLGLGAAAAFEAVTALPSAAQSLESALAAARRLFAIADTKLIIRETSNDRHNSRAPSGRERQVAGAVEVEFKDVKFAYGAGEREALNGLSFTLNAGAHVALVGPSGSGKTTVVNLLARFWEYESGSILINGRELKEYGADEVRSAIGVISQQTYLFNATLRENLLVAKPTATQAELDEAVARAQLTRFVESLPQGYETWVGEHGLRLSGGERQRVAIARALLRETPLLILDEPTANLDPATERDFLKALQEVGWGRTMLLITHRLVGLEAMDEVWVMEGGRIVQRGRQDELVWQEGMFQRLWAVQNRVIAS